MIKKGKIFLRFFLLGLLIQIGLNASSLEVTKEVIKRFFGGIIEANYREYPLSELIGLEKAVLPKPVFPQNSEHPSLLFNQSELSRLQKKALAQPYKDWLDEIFSATLSLPYLPSSPLLLEKERAKVAKMNAFCFAMSKQQHYRETALTALNHIGEVHQPTTPEGGEANIGWGDWMQAADALEMYAVAYDIMHGELTKEEKEEIQRKLAAMAKQMYHHFTKLPRDWSSLELSMGLGIPKNNHIIDIAVGVLTISLVLDVPEAETWFHAAYSELQAGLIMIYEDGSYREGYYYGMYVAQKMFTFFLYYEQTTGVNLFQVPRIKKFTRWLVDLLQNDGTYTLFDDAFPQQFIVFPLAMQLSPLHDELNYIFARDFSTYSFSDPAWLEIFCRYEQHGKKQNPYKEELIIYPDGGYSVFRGEKDLFALFLSQPGRPFLSGHSHIQPLSFTLSAYGEDMLIDAGYGPKGVNDINRNWFISAQAHNIPLINGQGHNQNPVWGDELGGKTIANFESNQFSLVSASAKYQDATINRHVLFSDYRYFIILDEIETDLGKRISIPWHGKGKIHDSGNGTFMWKQAESQLGLEYITFNNSAQFTTKYGLNTYKEKEHHYAAASFFMKDNKERIVSTFLPNSSLETNVFQSEIAVMSAGKVQGRVFSSEQRDILIVAEQDWTFEQVKSDAGFAFFSSDKQIDSIMLLDATYLTISEQTIFQSDTEVTIFLDLQALKGQIILPEKKQIQLSVHSKKKPNALILDDKITDFQYENECVHFVVTENSQFSFRISRTNDFPQVRESYPTLKYVSNYQISTDLRLLSYERKTQLRNEIIAISGKNMLAFIDSTVGVRNFSEKMYGLASGLHTNLWHANDKFKMSLPQKFRWEQQIGNWHFQYWERGILTEKGIQPYEQRIYVNDMLYISHENFFENHTFTQIDIFHSQKILHASYEKYHRKEAQELSFSDLTYQYQLNHRNDTSFVTESIRYHGQKFSLQSAYQYDKQEKFNQMKTGFGYRNRNNAFHNEMTMNDEEGIVDGTISIQNQIHPSLHSSTQLAYDANQNDLIQAHFHFYSHWKRFTQSLQHFVSRNQKWRFHYACQTHWKTWQINFESSKQEEWLQTISAFYKTASIQVENSIDSKENYTLDSEYFFSKHWNLLASLQTNYQNKTIRRYGFGGGLYGYFQGKLNVCPQLHFPRYLLDLLLRLPMGKNQLFHIQTEFSISEKREIEAYQIIIKQQTKNYTPGILISKDERGFTRYEGYLELFFY